MSHFFVDSTTGNDADAGTDMDLAWDTVEHAHEAGGLSAGDIVWVRRLHNEVPISNISAIYDGTARNPIQTIGCPRAAIPDTTITQADWTNGSRIIDNVVGITPSRTKHTARYCTAPDGEKYLITAVLWEAGFDGIGAGDAFAVGDILTNTTQTKKGKVWNCNGTETTDTLQYVRDSASAWVENDNVTSDGGGDGEVDASGETAVGFLIDREYPGSTVSGVNGKFQIEEDDDYDFFNFSDTFTADAGTDELTIASAHPYKTGDCARMVTTDTLPSPLAANTDYYIIYADTNKVKLATTLANANAGTNIDITTTGSGTHTIATIEDSAWTIQKSDWNGDADDLPVIDFNDADYYLAINGDMYHLIRGMELKDSTDVYGMIGVVSSDSFLLNGCLLKQTTQDDSLMRTIGMSQTVDRCVFEGSGLGSSQKGIYTENSHLHISNSAIFNCGDNAISVSGLCCGENVNLGIEMANGDNEFNMYRAGKFVGLDIALGGTNGYVGIVSGNIGRYLDISIENYQKVLGDNYKWFPGGTTLSVTAGAGSPVPNQRSGGATKLLEITPNVSGYEFIEEWAVRLFKWVIDATTDQKSYRIYIQNAMSLNTKEAEDIWFTLKYVSGYDDTSEYVYETLTSSSSNNPIPARADLDDWGEYIEITNVTPAVASNLFIELFWSKYDASNKCYIDPKLVIS